MRNIKVISFSLVILFLTALITLQPRLSLGGPLFPSSSLIYWLVLLFLIVVVSLKFDAEFYFLFALSLFGVSVIFLLLGLGEIAEISLRISFIGWLVGIGQALVEYKGEHDKKSP